MKLVKTTYLLLSQIIFSGNCCKGDEGSGPTLTTEGKACILPFTYEEYSGKTLTFDSCTTHNFGNIKWCATAVDDQGRYREGDGEFGICKEPKCKGKIEKTRYVKKCLEKSSRTSRSRSKFLS